MEMKDVVLSALAEIQNLEQEIAQMTQSRPPKPHTQEPTPTPPLRKQQSTATAPSTTTSLTPSPSKSQPTPLNGELAFLGGLRERLLVLFEGFQSPNNKSVEAKMDLTLNFLEYMLAVIDERMEKVKGTPKDSTL